MNQEVICRNCNKVIPQDELTTNGRVRTDGTRYFAKLCRKCRAIKAADYRKRNPERCREYNRKHYEREHFQYRLYASGKWARRQGHVACTATVNQIKKAFTGKCEACGVPEIECRTRLHMDHNHETGEFRGWLCDSCNRALGYLKDSSRVIAALLLYSERSKIKA